MTNDEYIRLHALDDVRALALRRAPEGVDAPWCLRQIAGRQTARRKLPRWAAVDGLWYPARLSLEQCSSEPTAEYKRSLVERLLPAAERDAMVDLTGGLGVDFSFLAPLFRRAVYVEQQEELCRLARHNLPLQGLTEAEVRCGSGCEGTFSLVFIDPARRDTAGRKTVAIADCSPDVAALLPELFERAPWVMVKLSPMLDIPAALAALRGVREVHVVGVGGECRELLLVMRRGYEGRPTYHCVNLLTPDPPLSVSSDTPAAAPPLAAAPLAYLYEPSAPILKAGLQDVLAARYAVSKLAPRSHLFTSTERVEGFPGRTFAVEDWGDFSRASLSRLLAGLRQANLTVRNFPATVAELRRRLRLREGGDAYLFATTLADGRHALVRCRKA